VVLEAAMTLFGVCGFLGTPTMDVAEAAGISHAYLFRLFPSGRVAVIDGAGSGIGEATARALAADGHRSALSAPPAAANRSTSENAHSRSDDWGRSLRAAGTGACGGADSGPCRRR
jgi:AcrR family transcriptional regulator